MEASHNSIESRTRRILNKTINEYRLLFPAPVHEVKFIRTKETLLIDFFDSNGFSISDAMINKKLTENETLHSRIAEQFNIYLEKSNYLIYDKEYCFRPFVKKGTFEYFNMDAISRLIRKEPEPISTLSYQINIDKSILYAMSNAQIRNYTANSLLKICFFFNKPVFYFLNRKYKKKYLENLTKDFVAKKLITEQQQEKIIELFCPPLQP